MSFLRLLVAPAAHAQNKAVPSPEALMDKMTGHWVMTGTIANKPITHDVDVDWVLNRQYIRIHEASREKGANGDLGYEAWIYVVWDAIKHEYAVMWLDNTAVTNFAPDGIGHAKPNGDLIPIIWKDREVQETEFITLSRTVAPKIRGHGRSITWINPGKHLRSRK